MRRFIQKARTFLALPIVPGWRTRFGDLVLITVFAALASLDALNAVVNRALGWDAIIYVHAVRALLSGGDAWGPTGAAALFAGPPTSLLPFFPFVWLPDPIVAGGGAAVAAACGVYTLRKLNLPMWWFLFPPVLLATLAGSSALPVTALLVRGGPLADGIAVALRPYAAVPLALLGRWRGLVVAAVIIVVTAPFLDWPRFLGKLDFIRALLDDQTHGGKSAAAIPLLFPIALVCLVLLGRRRAAWVAVPALWPYAQPYYAVIALPVVRQVPLVALALAVDFPGAVVAGLVAQVIVERLGERRELPVAQPGGQPAQPEAPARRQSAAVD